MSVRTALFGTRVAELAPGDRCRLHRGGPLVTIEDVQPSRYGPHYVALDVAWPLIGGGAGSAQAGINREVDARVHDHRPGDRAWTVPLLHAATVGRDLHVLALTEHAAFDAARAYVLLSEPAPAAVIIGRPHRSDARP